MDSHANPYRPGAGLQPPFFAGRESLLTDASVAMDRLLIGRSSKSFMLVGLRGVGKTALLQRYANLAEEAGMMSVVIEVAEGSDITKLLAARLYEVLLHMSARGMTSRIRNTLRFLQGFMLPANTNGYNEFVADSEMHTVATGDPSIDLLDIFLEVGEVARENKTTIFFAFDELHRLPALELGALIGAQHGAVQRSRPIFFVAAGLPQLPMLAAEARSYSERMFAVLPIGALSYQEMHHAVQIPAEAQGVRFEDDAVKEIYRVTQGFPYFVQEWAHGAWALADASLITIQNVAHASQAVLHRLSESFFQVRLDRLTDAEKRYLVAMGTLGDGAQSTRDIAHSLGKKSTALGSIRANLIRKGILYSPRSGEVAYTAPLFKEFLQCARSSLRILEA